MKISPRISCSVAAFALMSALSASHAMAAPGLLVSVQDEIITGSTGSFNVVVTNNTASPIVIGDTVARVFEDSINPDVVFGTPNPTITPPPIHAVGFFNHDGSVANTASDVSDNYSSGTDDTLGIGQTLGLMNVPITILNNFTGPIVIDVNTSPTNGTQLDNSDGSALVTYTPLSGTLTIVSAPTPEPASAALLGIGVLGLLKRRRSMKRA